MESISPPGDYSDFVVQPLHDPVGHPPSDVRDDIVQVLADGATSPDETGRTPTGASIQTLRLLVIAGSSPVVR